MHVQQSPWWVNARSLRERTEDPAPLGHESRLLSAWQESLPDELLARYAADLLPSPETLPAALSEASPPDGGPPAWIDVIARVSAAVPPHTPEEAASPEEAARLAVASAFETSARNALDGLRYSRPDVTRPLAANAGKVIASLWHRPIALELAAARLLSPGTAEQAEDAAWSFARSLIDPAGLRTLFESNPCIARMSADRSDLLIEAAERLLTHLHADLPSIDRELVPGAGGAKVTAVEALGDPHDGGRQVVKLSFDSGDAVMYKPRSLKTDTAYNRLLVELTERGLRPASTGVPTLDMGTERGWQAVVSAAACDDAASVARYFQRLGCHLALLYALRATDMHLENIVAVGEHPQMIDLETLFQPRLGGESADIYDPALGESSIQSVLRVGILPRPDGPAGLDLSGIGRDPDAPLAVADDTWAGWAIPAEKVHERLALGDNVARLDGLPVAAQDYVDDLASGFDQTYRLLEQHRDELLRPEGGLAAFRDCEIRVLLRPTQTYAFIDRHMAMSDGCLSDGLAQEKVLHVLWRSARDRSELKAVTAAEHDDLWRGDVPRLASRPGSSDLFHHTYGWIPNALSPHACPGPDVVLRLTPTDRERQVALLRTAVMASAPRPGGRRGQGGLPVRRPAILTPSGALVKAACVVARSLLRRGFYDDGHLSWLSPVDRVHPRAGAVLAPTRPDWGDGQAGLVWFLRNAADESGSHELQEAALAASRRLSRLAEEEELVRPMDLGGLLLALGGTEGAVFERIDQTSLDGPALAAAVIGLAGDGHSRRRLAQYAAKLARTDCSSFASFGAVAMARAAAILRDHDLCKAAMGAAETAADEDPGWQMMTWAAIARAHGVVPPRVRARIHGLLTGTPASETAAVTRLFSALAVRAWADVLGDRRAERLARTRVGDALDALDPFVCERSLETPGLRDGFAGAGAALLALARPDDGATEAALLLARSLPRHGERIFQLPTAPSPQPALAVA